MQQKIADDFDRKILRELQADARITNNELAERIGLSPSPCLRRVRRLEETGVIRGYTTLVDPAAFGWSMVAIATIRLSRQNEDEIVMFEDAIRGWEEVLECHLVTGSRDYVLKSGDGKPRAVRALHQGKDRAAEMRGLDRNQLRHEHHKGTAPLARGAVL
ncbi:AsnC family transcriptional regulator [Mesorhizobium loti]|uniref:AsnC family transcriptional regulator n=1 Tax=Rhizobium loti TaxID=381 RepID=A0A8E2WAE1_RHILI|nr:AsnC family transcriptional regulator [Mesorhizobium loti]